MLQRRSRSVLAITLLLIFLLALAAGRAAASPPLQSGPSTSSGAITSDGAPEKDEGLSPLEAVLALDRLPRPGEAAELTCTLTALMPVRNIEAQIRLPENVQPLSGQWQWAGALERDESMVFGGTVEITGEGDTAIYCEAGALLDEQNGVGDVAGLYFSVGEQETIVGFAPPPVTAFAAEMAVAPEGEIIDGEPAEDGWDNNDAPPVAGEPPLGKEGATPAAAAPAATSGDLTVTGRWMYYDRDDNTRGIREQSVELVRGDNWQHLAWCRSGVDGTFSCGPITNPGSIGVRARIHSHTNYGGGDVLMVQDPAKSSSGPQSSHRFYTPAVDFGDGTHSIGTWFVPNGHDREGAYWSQRDLVDTYRYIYFQGNGRNTATGGPTTVLWNIDSTDGTYYDLNGDQKVHLAGADPRSTTTTIHEYTHNIMDNVYTTYPDFPNCNPHSIPGASSQGCAWTEGWAEFVPAVVNDEPVYRWANGFSLNLENPTPASSGWDDGDDVEGRVVGALWDIYDGNNEGNDQFTHNDFATFWDLFTGRDDANLSAYWDNWLANSLDNSSAGPLMSILQNAIDYRLGPGNDDFDDRYPIGVGGSVANWPTGNATTEALDPELPCGYATTPRQSRSVWYHFDPPSGTRYTISTGGSDYDTVLAVHRLDWRGDLDEVVGCNDDFGGALTSQLSLILSSQEAYAIEVARYGAGTDPSPKSLELSLVRGKPVEPLSLVATAGQQDNAPQVELSWDTQGILEDSYEIERRPAGTFAWTQLAGVTDDHYVDTTVSNDQEYEYRVRAYRSADGLYSAYSNVASVAVPAAPIAPAVTIQVIDPLSQTVRLAWQQQNANSEYRPYFLWPDRLQGDVDDATPLTADALSATTTSYEHTPTMPGIAYGYIVVAYNSLGQMAPSETVARFPFTLVPGE